MVVRFRVDLAAQCEGHDFMHLSDVPFLEKPCKEMTPEFEQ